MAINLANDACIDPQEHRDLLGDLQGNILKGHGREHLCLLMVSFTAGDAEAKAWLRPFGRGWVTSALKQSEQTADYRTGRDVYLARELPFANLFLTAKGYRYIGVADEKIPNDPQFGAGMLQSQWKLNDPAGSEWDPPYDPTTQPIHAMVLLAASNPIVLERAVSVVEDSLSGIATLRRKGGQPGQALKDTANDDSSERYVEHLNYLDGRSQPLFYRDDHDKEVNGDGTGEYDPWAPLSLVLTKDPSGGPHGYGSYLVYRKLEQKVREFKERERKPGAAGKARSLADRLGLQGEDRKRVGAMIVGRFENGTPLALAPRNSLRSAPNNFSFVDDPKGLKCPLFAHIRKVNPRTEESRSHRIARRAIPYEDIPRAAPPSDERQAFEQMPSVKVGLLFMCFQSSIENQFEHLQVAANSPHQPVAGAGIDPLIGQPDQDQPVAHRWRRKWGGGTSIARRFDGFVRLKEGEYFFAPSISFFKGLGSPP